MTVTMRLALACVALLCVSGQSDDEGCDVFGVCMSNIGANDTTTFPTVMYECVENVATTQSYSTDDCSGDAVSQSQFIPCNACEQYAVVRLNEYNGSVICFGDAINTILLPLVVGDCVGYGSVLTCSGSTLAWNNYDADDCSGSVVNSTTLFRQGDCEDDVKVVSVTCVSGAAVTRITVGILMSMLATYLV